MGHNDATAQLKVTNYCHRDCSSLHLSDVHVNKGSSNIQVWNRTV